MRYHMILCVLFVALAAVSSEHGEFNVRQMAAVSHLAAREISAGSILMTCVSMIGSTPGSSILMTCVPMIGSTPGSIPG